MAADKSLGLPAELDRLVDSFAAVPDAKLRYQQLLFFARKLPSIDESLKTDANLVRGCTSVVYVNVSLNEDGTVKLEGTSDAQLTKGLVALLVNGLKGCSIEEILAVDPAFIKASGLAVSLTPSRNNGFINMVAKIKEELKKLKNSEAISAGNEAGSAEAEVFEDIPGRPVYSSIMRKMRALQPLEVDLQDNSAQHAGHAAAKDFNGESHFAVRVVSDAFDGIPLVKRHQLIYALLNEEMKSVHALNIEARTPTEVAPGAKI